jgi:hypothetical protein
MKPICYDSFPRSGSHFLAACLNKSFPNNNFLWGKHDIRFLSIPTMTTVIRNPIDSISSLAVMDSQENNIQYMLDTIRLNSEWLSNTLENFNNINIILFEDLINNTETVVKNIQTYYNIDILVDYNYKDILPSLVSENDVRNAYAPYEKKMGYNKIAKDNLLSNTDSLEKVLSMYQEIKDHVNAKI